MNSINWPVSSVWVFIAQLGEHCSTNAEATGSNRTEAPKKLVHFFGLFHDCLDCDLLRWSHVHFICIPAVHIISFCIRIMPFFRTGAQDILLSLCLHKSYLDTLEGTLTCFTLEPHVTLLSPPLKIAIKSREFHRRCEIALKE